MLSPMDAAPPPTEVRRTVAVDFLFLELAGCGRVLPIERAGRPPASSLRARWPGRSTPARSLEAE